jgi:hypothetical protein
METVRKSNIARRLLGILVKTILALFVIWIVLIFFLSSTLSWPILKTFERKHIYGSSRERVEKAGGWKSVEQACLNFATNGFNPNQHEIYYLHGRHFSTNTLPKTIELLQPMFLETTKDQNGVPIFQVVLSCGHRTGTYEAPYYGIWVVCTNRPDYVPTFGFHFRGAEGIVERKGDSIFEAR